MFSKQDDYSILIVIRKTTKICTKIQAMTSIFLTPDIRHHNEINIIWSCHDMQYVAYFIAF